MVERLWIGPQEGLKEGEVGFLIRKHRESGGDRIELRDTPAYTNRSHEPRLVGWCGSDNGISTLARGMARVERVAHNGRALVVELEGDELKAALEELGYPELLS